MEIAIIIVGRYLLQYLVLMERNYVRQYSSHNFQICLIVVINLILQDSLATRKLLSRKCKTWSEGARDTNRAHSVLTSICA